MDITKVTPQNDALFKMIFTDPKHERVLIHFLNCAIEAKDPIRKVKILNAETTKRHVEQRGSRLDIKAETNGGELIDIEMQIGVDLHMVGRTLFYWSQLFSGQLVIGERYSELRRTISINILNFNLFRQDKRYWRKCHLADDFSHERITDLLEIQFVELNKMRQFDRESPITFWIEFFKNPYSEACKELYKVVPELREAKEIFEQAKADPKKRRLIEEREDTARNFASAISTAREEGMAKGIEEGMAKGIEEGMAKGIEEGEKNAKIETARKMLLDGLTMDVVAKYSGLSIAEIEALK